MSIIQDIRDKYAKVTVVLIALALLGFVLTDYFQQKGRGGGGGSTTNSLGSVNGTTIKLDEYNAHVAQFEQQYKNQGYPAEMATSQAKGQAWDNEVGRLLLAGEANTLGITVGKKELGDMLYGTNPPADLKQQFTDEKTGLYNAALAKQNIEQMLKKGTAEQKASFSLYLEQLGDQRKQEKYISLFSNSVNVPRWFVEKQNADNSQLAKVSFVKEIYTSIPDSTIKIEDKEIAEVINKNKDRYKQEENRSIAYVAFNASASAADSSAAKNKLLEQKAALDSAKDVKGFLAKQGAFNYYDSYINSKSIQIAVKDSIFRTPVGSVYGPYLDGGSYVLARVEGVTTMPDTVKVRHILIGLQQRDSATAHKLTDSLAKAIAAGSNFDSLCAKFSDDGGSKDKGGLYEDVYSGKMVAPFNDFIFRNPVGSKGIVPTEFGIHYVEILSQKGSGPAYKIAYLPSEIIASQVTDNAALEAANIFFGDSRDQKAFDANYEKSLKAKGIQKLLASNIKPADDQVGQMGMMGGGSSRELVRSIYSASKGEVIKPERVGENYIVAVVTEVFKEGTQSVAAARPGVEPALRNKKKAEILKKKVGTVTTLEAAAAALGGKPIEVADSIRMDAKTPSALGFEPKAIGAAFNPANKGKVVPEVIEGTQGVYVIKVENVSTTPVTAGSVEEQRKERTNQKKQSNGNPLGALRAAATIKDKRGERL